MNQTAVETMTKAVYGETFARYSREEFLDFLRPLEVRLAVNGIPAAMFNGKRCFDAGCGGGRGTVLMARAGASEVIAYDLAPQNLMTTARHAALFDLHNVRTQCGSLLEIPYPDESFDIVWCNGVLHHTVDPDRALQEVVRVLKVGGHLWLYLYGAGGIYWFMVDFLREWLRDIDVRWTLAALLLAGTPTGRIAEFIDDWYVPILKRYTVADVSRRLQELGIAHPRYLKAGMPYDTSMRRGEERENLWMGEGDIRYWGEKTSAATGQNAHMLPDVNNKGSAYPDPPQVRAFATDFSALTEAVTKIESVYRDLGKTARISLAARMQTWLRDTLARPEPFDSEAFHFWLRVQTQTLQTFLPE